MLDLYKSTIGRNVYLEENGKVIEIEKLEIGFDKRFGFSYYAKIDGEWYVINATDEKCKIVIE